jgi:hypothetical protein
LLVYPARTSSTLWVLGEADSYYYVWGRYLPVKQKQLVQEILARAEEKWREGGREGVKEETRRVIWMGIAVAGTPGENLFCTLGGADALYDAWGSYLPAKKQLVHEILDRAVEKRSEDGREDGREGVKEGSRRAIWMGLAVAGTPRTNLLYTLGGADTHYDTWGSYLHPM